MAAAEKTPPPVDRFAWDPDPLVLVSAHNRVLPFPAALLRGDMTDEQVRRHFDPPRDPSLAGAKDEKTLNLIAGVNFLGARTTSWAYLKTAPQGAPSGPPDPNATITVWPYCTGHDVITQRGGPNWDRDSGKVRPAGIHATLVRILEFSRKHQRPGEFNLWETVDGFDAPELSLLRLSDVFRQTGEAGRHAHATAVNSVAFLRRTPDVIAHVGALHDYAIRDRAGSGILAACRTWAQRKKIG